MVETAVPRRAVVETAAPRRAVVLAVAGETALALVLGLVNLRSRSFWQDEAFTWSTVDRSFPDLVSVIVRHEGFQILHSLLLWPVNGVRSSVAALRFPSLLAYAATVPAVWLLGRRLYGEAAGLVAGLLLALNAFALRYGQEARSYSLAMMLTTFAGAALVRYSDSPSRPTRIRWIGLSALAIHAHGFAVLAVGAQAASLGLLPGSRTLRPLRSSGWIAFWASPALVLPVVQIRSGDVSWIERPDFEGFVDVVWSMSGQTFTTFGPYVLAGFAALWAAAREVRRDERRGFRSVGRWRIALLLGWGFGPSAVLWLASYVSPIWVARYAIWSLGAIVLLVARGLTLIRRPVLLVTAVVVVALLAARGVDRWYDEPAVDDFAAAAAFAAADTETGDVFLFAPDEARIGFEFYARRTTIVQRTDSLFPSEPWGAFKTGDHEAGEPARDDVARAGEYDRVWVLLRNNDVDVYRRLVPLLADHRLAAHRTFEGSLVVLLFERT